jgi:hypothetical protein
LLNYLGTSALDGGDLSASRPSRLTPTEGSLVPIEFNAGWAPEPIRTLWSREKYLTLTGNRSPAVQSEAGRYTDRAIPAPLVSSRSLNYFMNTERTIT